MNTDGTGSASSPIEPGDSAIVFDLTGAVHLAVPQPKPIAEHIVPPSAIIAAAMYILMGEDPEWFAKIMERSNRIQQDLGDSFTCKELIQYTNKQYDHLHAGEKIYDDGKSAMVYRPDLNWMPGLNDDDENKGNLN